MGRAAGTKTATADQFGVLGTRRGAARPQDDLPEHERMRDAALSANGTTLYVRVEDCSVKVRPLCRTGTWTGFMDGASIYLEGELAIDPGSGQWVSFCSYGRFTQRDKFVCGRFYKLSDALDALDGQMRQLTEFVAKRSGKPTEDAMHLLRAANEDQPERLTAESVARRLDVISGHTPGGLPDWPRNR